MAQNGQHWRGVICGLLQFECFSATMGTRYCGPMYSKLCITVSRTYSMQKFHSKMTPCSLCTKFPLTEITYAKVCISPALGRSSKWADCGRAGARSLCQRDLGSGRVTDCSCQTSVKFAGSHDAHLEWCEFRDPVRGPSTLASDVDTAEQVETERLQVFNQTMLSFILLPLIAAFNLTFLAHTVQLFLLSSEGTAVGLIAGPDAPPAAAADREEPFWSDGLGARLVRGSPCLRWSAAQDSARQTGEDEEYLLYDCTTEMETHTGQQDNNQFYLKLLLTTAQSLP